MKDDTVEIMVTRMLTQCPLRNISIDSMKYWSGTIKYPNISCTFDIISYEVFRV